MTGKLVFFFLLSHARLARGRRQDSMQIAAMPRCLVPSKSLKGSKGGVTSEEEGHDVVMAGAQCVVAKDTTSAGELAEETDDTRSPAARRLKSLPWRGRT